MNVIIISDVKLFTLEDLEEPMRWIESLGSNKYLNLYEGDFSSVDAMVRARISSDEANKFTIADAFVVKNFTDEMLSSFYIKFNKPVKPTMGFKSREEAINWLLTFKHTSNDK